MVYINLKAPDTSHRTKAIREKDRVYLVADVVQPACRLGIWNAIGATRLASAALLRRLLEPRRAASRLSRPIFRRAISLTSATGMRRQAGPSAKQSLTSSQSVQIATAAPKSAPRFGRYPARWEEGARQLREPGGISSRRRTPLPAERVGQVRFTLLASFADVGILQASTQVDPSQKRKISMPTMLEEAAIRGPMIFLRYWTRQILVSFRLHPRIPENLAGEA